MVAPLIPIVSGAAGGNLVRTLLSRLPAISQFLARLRQRHQTTTTSTTNPPVTTGSDGNVVVTTSPVNTGGYIPIAPVGFPSYPIFTLPQLQPIGTTPVQPVPQTAGQPSQGDLVMEMIANLPVEVPQISDLLLSPSGDLIFSCQPAHLVYMYDMGTNSLVRLAGTGQPTSPGGLQTAKLPALSFALSPIGLTIGSDGLLYIADASSKRLLRMDMSAATVEPFAASSLFRAPAGLDTTQNAVVMCDVLAKKAFIVRSANDIQEYVSANDINQISIPFIIGRRLVSGSNIQGILHVPSGRWVGTHGTSADSGSFADVKFRYPANVMSILNGQACLVADSGNGRVVMLDFTNSTYQTLAKSLRQPTALAPASGGFYVADSDIARTEGANIYFVSQA